MLVLLLFLVSCIPRTAGFLAPISTTFSRPCPMSLTSLHSKSKKDDFTQKIEGLMKKTNLVGDDYKFGDVTKRTLASTFQALDEDGDGVIDPSEIANAAKTTIEKAAKATRIVGEDYEFGDLTKKASESITKTAEKTVQTITGDESYKFGDYTSKFLTEGDKALSNLRDEAFNQIPKQVWTDMLGDLTEAQREAVAIALIQLAATAVLAFNLAMNFITSFTWMRAWKVVVSATRLSPIANAAQWAKLIQARSSVAALIGPLALPLAAGTTIFLLIPYKDFVENLEKRMLLKRKYPVMNRALTLLVSCLAINVGVVGTATSSVFWVLNKIYI